ncbi:ribosomal maturation YjgA family protein [Shewanella sp. 125m-1]
MLTFKPQYFVYSNLLLLLLIFIALFINDGFIRPFIGDLLVVIWMFLLLASFINLSPIKLSVSVLILAYSIEIAQYFKLVNLLGLQNNSFARTVIGSTFDWLDFLAYSLGWLAIVTGLAIKNHIIPIKSEYQ